MSASKSACQQQTIRDFLDDQLSDFERQQFEEHLSSCTWCRAALEDCSAEGSWWQEARDHLAGELASHEVDEPLRRLGFLAPTDDPQMLGRLGGYEIAGVIGYGGMGVVLKGFDGPLNRYVAIKLLAPHLATSAAARRRFAREAQAAAAVVHDNVVEIHGVAEWQKLPYLVMPYVRGTSLQKRLDEAGSLGPMEVLRIGIQTAAGLAAAHAQGLVHRDIKPANILLAEGVERVKITDFGLARAADDASLTRSGVIAGTPQYMSPEQARGDTIDHRSDLFSLGSVLYAMCTGRPPFRAETSYGVLRLISEGQPRPIRELNPDIPEWLERIIARLHAKDPAARFQSASEVAQLLERCLAHLQQPKSVPLPTSLTKVGGRSRVAWAALAGSIVLAMLLTAAGGYAWLNWVTDPPASAESQTPPPAAAQVAPSTLEPVEPAVWQDGIEQQLNEVQDELRQLEAELSAEYGIDGTSKEGGESF